MINYLVELSEQGKELGTFWSYRISGLIREFNPYYGDTPKELFRQIELQKKCSMTVSSVEREYGFAVHELQRAFDKQRLIHLTIHSYDFSLLRPMGLPDATLALDGVRVRSVDSIQPPVSSFWLRHPIAIGNFPAYKCELEARSAKATGLMRLPKHSLGSVLQEAVARGAKS